MADPYRSYVVRIRRRPDAPESLRIEVEDLLGGRRSTVRGRPAQELSDELLAAVDGAGPSSIGPAIPRFDEAARPLSADGTPEGD